MTRKKRLLIGIAGVSLLLLLSIRCEDIIAPGAPQNLVASAHVDGVSVKLGWDAVTDADGYIVYFNDDSLASVTTNEYIHTTPNTTGEYKVSAYTGGEESGKSGAVSTVPVETDNVELYEISGAGSSGFGWHKVDGDATSYSMADASHANEIDLYFSNFVLGDYTTTPYNIASPDLFPLYDNGPSGNWNVRGFIKLGANFPNVTTLPDPSAESYENYTEVVQGTTYGVYMKEDGASESYFGMVKVQSVNPTNGTVTVQAAFQKIKGLRLLKVK